MLELLTSDFRLVLQTYVAWTICLAALIWGGGPERAVALTWLLIFEIADGLYHAVFEQSYSLVNVDAFHAAHDVVAWIGFTFIALNANRNYTLCIAAMQLLAVVAHLSRSLSEMITPIAYAVMVIAPGWLQLLCLTIGLLRHVRRKRRYGEYRDWRILRNPPGILALLSGTRGKFDLFPSTKGTSSWRDVLK